MEMDFKSASRAEVSTLFRECYEETVQLRQPRDTT
jgi:hypothetical protein